MLKNSLRIQKRNQRGKGGCSSGEGLLDRLKDKYGFWVGKGGVPTIDDRLNQFGIQSVEMKQNGSGFWGSLLSVLSVLPIPFVSDIARTISIAKTGVDTITGHSDPALGGLITKALAPLAKAVPSIGKPVEALAKSVGFGMNLKTSPQYVSLFHLVDVLSRSLPAIQKMEPGKKEMVLKTYENLKELLKNTK